MKKCTDDLGRIILPKEYRRTLGIKECDPLEVLLDGEDIKIRKCESGKGTMGKIIMKKRRMAGSFKYHNCTRCGHEDVIEKPMENIDMPYCSKCGKIVLDQQQVYCCWCGVKFTGMEQGNGRSSIIEAARGLAVMAGIDWDTFK